MPSLNRNSTIVRADWFAARALLATRRLRAFVPVGLVAFALVFVTIFAMRGLPTERAANLERAADRVLETPPDTLLLVDAARSARSELALRDSALQELLFQAETRAAGPGLPPELLRARDSLRTNLAQLDGALSRAIKAPLEASYRTLANTRAMRSMLGVQELVDTLDQLDRLRLTLDPVETPQREFAQLTQQSNAVGGSLQEMAQAQRAAMARQLSTVEGSASGGTGNAISGDTLAAARLARDLASTSVTSADSLLREARQGYATIRARSDSAENARRTYVLGASPFAAAIAALVVAGALIFTLAVAAEARRPTVAHAREVERRLGVPVLGTAFAAHLPDAGRARLRLGAGIDPLRMVYLALTAGRTPERTVCITGDDPDVVAAIAGRLAVSAAADARATVVVDVAPGTASVARYFGERHEPGFSEAIAAVRLWREVARSVGASEGLGLDVVPAGARRADTAASVAMTSNRSEFMLFASEYDFTVMAATHRGSLETALLLCERPATIYVASIAKTPLYTLKADVTVLQGLALNLQGILLVDDGRQS